MKSARLLVDNYLVQVGKPRRRQEVTCTHLVKKPIFRAARALAPRFPSGRPYPAGDCAAPRRPRVEGELRRESRAGGAGRGDNAEPGPPLAPTPGAHSARPLAAARELVQPRAPLARARPPPAPVRRPPRLHGSVSVPLARGPPRAHGVPCPRAGAPAISGQNIQLSPPQPPRGTERGSLYK